MAACPAARLLVILPLAASCATAQQARNPHAWFLYSADHSLTTRWGIHFDTQYRARQGLGATNQTVLRPGINFSPHPSVLLQVGYASHTNFPEESPRARETRLYQQAAVTHAARRTELQHRLRVEERWLSGQYENRYRYQSRWIVPHTRDGWYTAAAHELLISQGPIGRAERNRFLALLGRELSPEWRVEGGYQARRFLRNGSSQFVHTLQFGVYCRVPLKAR